jgi:hypothetical protein
LYFLRGGKFEGEVHGTPPSEPDDFQNPGNGGLERGFILQQVLEESFRLLNSESKRVVKSLHIFPEGRLLADDDLQAIALAEFANPPEKVALQKFLYVGDLLFPALGANDLSYDFHPTGPSLTWKERILSFSLF